MHHRAGWISLLATLSAVGMLCWKTTNNDGSLLTLATTRTKSKTTAATQPPPPLYTCPSQFHSLDAANADEPAVYSSSNAPIVRAGLDTFVKTFTDPNSTFLYDGWGENYATVADGMAPWKRSQTAAFLATRRDDDSPISVYESAAGLGLNSFMTVAVLLDEYHYGGSVTVYGNEYVAASATVAAQLYAAGLYGHRNVLWGALCASDSRDLSYVPSDSFDLVLSGYITPLQDPFATGQEDWRKDITHDVCPNATAVAAMQSIQETWYGQWVTEMVRIAKPGAPIWIEQVSPPLCDEDDWGGVAPSFWTRRAASWGVSVTAFMNDTQLNVGRYHVALLKNKKESPSS